VSLTTWDIPWRMLGIFIHVRACLHCYG